jgi:hypothetical protein
MGDCQARAARRIVVSGTAAVVLIIIGVVIWIAESADKARRLAEQRAKNRQLKAQAQVPTQPQMWALAPDPNVDERTLPEDTGAQPSPMPYGM